MDGRIARRGPRATARIWHAGRGDSSDYDRRIMATRTQLGIVAVAVAGLAVAAAACQRPAAADPADTVPAAPLVRHRVVQTFPHDRDAFTQGLIFQDGYLFESTGLNGRSSLRKVELETGRIIERRPVDDEYFAEGLTAWRSELIQLTWQSHVGFVYDAGTMTRRRTVDYPWEGWGLTEDGTSLILSDGSAVLRFLDPDTFHEVRRIVVSDPATGRVDRLNELEFVKGSIYANVWQTDRIAIISPADGRVTGWLDLADLRPRPDDGHPIDVLNGIAYDAAGDRLFVTGKWWPQLFEIETGP